MRDEKVIWYKAQPMFPNNQPNSFILCNLAFALNLLFSSLLIPQRNVSRKSKMLMVGKVRLLRLMQDFSFN